MKFNKIFALPALALTLFGFSACTDEVSYEPAQPETNAEVFFPSTLGTSIALDNDQNSFNVEICRAETAGAVTVALSGSSTDNIFSIPSQVAFADGAETAQVPVDFDFSSLEANKEYQVTITIDDAAATSYGKRTQTFTVKYAPWSAWKTMSGYGDFTFTMFFSDVAEVTVETRTNLLDPNEIEYNIVASKSDFYANDMLIKLNKQTNSLTVPMQLTGLKVNSADCYVADSYTFWSSIASNPNYPGESFKESSKFDSETGMMTLNLVYFRVNENKTLGIYTAGQDEFLQLPGYPDYKLYFSNNGSQITEEGEELAVITIAKGSDVNGFAMQMCDGWLSADDIEEVADAIKADANATVYYNGGDYTFPMTKSGYKTLVCVTYNEKGEVIGTQYYQFNYEIQQVDWNEGWKSLGMMNYTDYFVYSKPATWEVEVQESEARPGLLRIVKPYATHPGVAPSEVARGHYYIYINATNPNQVYIPLSTTCLGYRVTNEAYYILATGGTAEDVTEAGAWGTYKDGKVSFPAETLLLFVGSDVYVVNDEEVTILEPIEEEEGDEGEELSAKVASTQSFSVNKGKLFGTFYGVQGKPVVGKQIDKSTKLSHSTIKF